MVFLGSIMKTERMVNAMPFESTLVVSWWSILFVGENQYKGLSKKGLLCARNLHVIGVGDLSVLVTNDGELETGSSNLINVPDPICVRLDGIRGQTDKLGSTLGELGLELGECAQLGGANRGEVL